MIDEYNGFVDVVEACIPVAEYSQCWCSIYHQMLMYLSKTFLSYLP